MSAVLTRWAALILLALATGAVCWLQGAEHVQREWDLADARRVVAGQSGLIKAYAKVREGDAAAGAAMAAIGRKHLGEQKREKNDSDRFVAGLRAGNVRLQLPVGGAGAAGGLRLPQSTGAGPVCHGDAGAQLPTEVAGDLAALADDADDVARQLGSCQAALIVIREACLVQAQ